MQHLETLKTFISRYHCTSTIGNVIIMSNETCKIEGCNEIIVAKGLCRKHYNKHWYDIKSKLKTKPSYQPSYQALMSILIKYKEAKATYDNVIGVESRIRWKRKIDSLKKEAIALNVDLDKIPDSVIEENRSRSRRQYRSRSKQRKIIKP
jgi:hypothetical protein